MIGTIKNFDGYMEILTKNTGIKNYKMLVSMYRNIDILNTFLQWNGGMTIRNLRDRSGISSKTILNKIRSLKSFKLINTYKNHTRTYYHLSSYVNNRIIRLIRDLSCCNNCGKKITDYNIKVFVHQVGTIYTFCNEKCMEMWKRGN